MHSHNQSQIKLLEIGLGLSPEQIARLGWALGNLHFPMEIRPGALRVVDDGIMREFLARLNTQYREVTDDFKPLDITTETGHHHHNH